MLSRKTIELAIYALNALDPIVLAEVIIIAIAISELEAALKELETTNAPKS